MTKRRSFNRRQRTRTFVSKLAVTKQVEQQSETEFKKKLLASLAKEGFNLVLLACSAILITVIWYIRIAKPYLEANQVFGGLFLNDLTLFKFISQQKPFPPTGWMSFWNEGVPVIGGYPTLFYYLISPLTHFLDTVTSLQLAAMLMILFYLISAIILFFEKSRSILVALIFTFILLITPATYFNVVVKGTIPISSVALLLPIILLLISKFSFRRKHGYLTTAALLAAAALLLHPISAIITIIIPVLIFLFFSDKQPFKTKASQIVLFLGIAILASLPVSFQLINGQIAGTTAGPCNNLLCWGNYPEDLRWFSLTMLIPVATFLLPLIYLIWKKRTSTPSQLKSLTIIIVWLVTFVMLAKLKLINNISGEFAPQQMFWALSLSILTLAATAFGRIKSLDEKIATMTSSVFVILIALSLPIVSNTLRFDITRVTPISATIPAGLEKYIIEKYQESPTSEVIPNWMPVNDHNWRVESIRPNFYIWWNAYSNTPSIRGYANLPPESGQDWLFFFQKSLLTPTPDDQTPERLRKNRGLSLLEAYGIGYIHESSESVGADLVGYDSDIIGMRGLIAKDEKLKNWTFSELSREYTSPIITPTNAGRVLTVTDRSGYDTLLRAFSFTYPALKNLILIKGPESINDLNQQLLNQVDALVLYQFTGSEWQTIETFIENGGLVYVDIGAVEKYGTNIPQVPGIESLELYDEESEWQLKELNSPLIQGINKSQFAPLRYGQDAWKIVAPSSQTQLEEWVTPVLLQNNRPILSEGTIGEGKIIFSGFNLPYHIISYNNFEEVELLANIMEDVAQTDITTGDFLVERPNPSTVNIRTTNATGIMFKENYHPGWKATVNGSKAPILKASFGFMYIPIPKDLWQSSIEVDLRFRGNLTTWGLPTMSLLTIIITITLSFTTKPLEPFRKLLKKRVSNPMRNWWSNEY